MLLELSVPNLLLLQSLWPTTLPVALPVDEAEKKKCQEQKKDQGWKKEGQELWNQDFLGDTGGGGRGVGLRTKAVLTQVVMD